MDFLPCDGSRGSTIEIEIEIEIGIEIEIDKNFDAAPYRATNARASDAG